MDKTEQLADMVIQAAQVFIDRKLAPIMAGFESMKRELDLRGFITKEEAIGMFADLALVNVVDGLQDKIDAKSSGPTLDQVKTEASAAALDACTKLLESIPKPADGKSVSMSDVLPEIERLVGQIPRPTDGKDADPNDMAAEVARQIALVPPPSDGKSVDLGAIFTEIGAAVSRAVDALPPPEPGKSVTLDDVRPLIDNGVADAVAAIPRPEDGKSVTLDDVRPMLSEMVSAIPVPQNGKDAEIDYELIRQEIKAMIPEPIKGEPGEPGERGKDAAPVTIDYVYILDEVAKLIPQPIHGGKGDPGEPGKDAIIDYELIENRIRENIPEPIKGDPGKDADLAVLNDMVSDKVKAAMAEFRPPEKGEPGKDAEPLDMEEVRRYLTGEVSRELATWERPKNGADGLGFDDLDMELKDDGRTMVLRFMRGDRVKEFSVLCPWQIYRDVYEAGRSYTRGDVVTYAGSQFTAKRDTDKKPGTDDWVLSVKRGKDAA